MELPLHAAALVLLAALFHAIWNAVVKSGGDRLVTLATVNGARAVLALAVVLVVDFPAAAAWPFLLASVVLHTGYYLFLAEAYRLGDLAQAYPISRGLSPILVALAAAVLVGEWLPALATLGLILAAGGVASLAFEAGPPWRSNPRGVLFALGTAVFIGAYTVVDGMGVRRADAALGYIAWLSLLDGAPLIALVALRRGRAVRGLSGTAWRDAAIGGILQFTAYGVVIWAMSVAPMAYVSALRETSVIFAALIGALWLKEGFGPVRICATCAVAIGVVVMKVAGG